MLFPHLRKGAVSAAVIPIENSLAGSVSEHFDLLLTHDVVVEREALLRIRHNLIAISGTSIGEIDRVFSHPVALAQCRRFLADHPRMESYAFYDTAGSVKQLVELRDRHAAAIASEAAAQYYGAQILQADIEDNPRITPAFFSFAAPKMPLLIAHRTKSAWRFQWRTVPARWYRHSQSFRHWASI